MNQRIQELLVEAKEQTKEGKWHAPTSVWAEKFAELIVRECIDTLLWHGCDDAVPYIEWMAVNKLGVKQ